MNNRFASLVITGGPCAGKSTVIAALQQRLTAAGIFVVLVPEAAREMRRAGLVPGRTVDRHAFQRWLLQHTVSRENSFRNVACSSSAERIVMLCDRGAMDGQAYVGVELFQRILDAGECSLTSLRDGRYDGIIHLRSAAFGPDGCYRTDGERLETPEEARALDERTLAAWTGHPHLAIIEPTPDFETKIRRVVQTVFRLLGIPVPLEIERKFLVSPPDPGTLPSSAQRIEIVQHYLLNPRPDEEHRIRSWSQGGAATYFYTVKRPQANRPGIREETERRIGHETYETLRELADQNSRPIRKTRTCFAYGNQYFELDDLSPLIPGLYVLEIELTEEQQEVNLPPFLNVIREVTGDPAYTNRELARVPAASLF